MDSMLLHPDTPRASQCGVGMEGDVVVAMGLSNYRERIECILHCGGKAIQ